MAIKVERRRSATFTAAASSLADSTASERCRSSTAVEFTEELRGDIALEGPGSETSRWSGSTR